MSEQLPTGALYAWMVACEYNQSSLMRYHRSELNMILHWSGKFRIVYNIQRTHYTVVYNRRGTEDGI
jgi:hypothetical protein